MMIAVGISSFDIFLGLGILFLPLLVTELSRPRDQFWGAVLILFGLILLVNKDRLSGSLNIGVILATLLINRLGWEVLQNRLLQLGNEEKLRLASFERWTTSFKQLGVAFAYLGGIIGEFFNIVIPKNSAKKSKKKWIRPSPLQDEAKSESSGISNLHETSSNINKIDEEQLKHTSDSESPSKDS